jgi:hypothetical protein
MEKVGNDITIDRNDITKDGNDKMHDESDIKMIYRKQQQTYNYQWFRKI